MEDPEGADTAVSKWSHPAKATNRPSHPIHFGRSAVRRMAKLNSPTPIPARRTHATT